MVKFIFLKKKNAGCSSISRSFVFFFAFCSALSFSLLFFFCLVTILHLLLSLCHYSPFVIKFVSLFSICDFVLLFLWRLACLEMQSRWEGGGGLVGGWVAGKKKETRQPIEHSSSVHSLGLVTKKWNLKVSLLKKLSYKQINHKNDIFVIRICL